jgi:erythromycin esterase-like protein
VNWDEALVIQELVKWLKEREQDEAMMSMGGYGKTDAYSKVLDKIRELTK